jgi:glutamate synthase domain-containing protein 3
MTRGNIIVCGKVERNIAAGMTGGYLFLHYELNKEFL